MSKREKLMLLVLLVVVGSYLFFEFALNPQLDKFTQVKEKNAELELKVKRIEKATDGIKDKETGIKELKDQLDKLSVHLFESYEEEHIGAVFNKIINESEVDVSSIDITEPQVEIILIEKKIKNEVPETTVGESYRKVIASFGESQRRENSEEGEEKAKDENPTTALKISISMNLTGTYSGIMKFISTIENHDKKFMIKDIALNSSSEEFGEMSCVISVDAIISPLPMEDEFNFLKQGKRDNPFASIGEDDTKLNFIQRNPDLYMQLRPTSSDINTMIMGRYNDPSDGRIDVDSGTVLEGNISIKEENGKVLIKYSLGEVNYPEQGYSEIFVNEDGVILLEIESVKRNDGDTNGVKMTINNESSLKFIYKITGDDKKNPRFVLSSKKGNVQGE